MFRIEGERRSYDWGSVTSMAEFLGAEPDGQPFAELWFGAHPSGPSIAALADGRREPLDALIDADPEGTLGGRVVAEHESRLPFLLKLLAPGRPLSMQVHPSPHVAQQGFAAENAARVPLDSPSRSFKDPFHKPEMVYALTRFEGLVGFRDPAVAGSLLSRLDHPVARQLGERLAEAPGPDRLRETLVALLALPSDDVRAVVTESSRLSEEHPDAEARAVYATVVELAGWYPGDIGAVVSLLLNRVLLQPGELVFLGDGVPHAYLRGFGLELMANSDNVLRLGLTTKLVDAGAMVESLNLNAVGFEVEWAVGSPHTFAPPVSEFALSVATVTPSRSETVVEGADGPRVVIGLGGTVRLTAEHSGDSLEMRQGEAAFVSAADGQLRVDGEGTFAQAFVPTLSAKSPGR